MGRRASNRGLPAWYKGRLIRDHYSGFWYGTREGKLFDQEEKLVDRANFDEVTDKQREDQIQRMAR